MFTDIVGYTLLTQRDESSTLQALERHRGLLRPLFSSHGGREIKTIGDAFLVEFQSALDAVLCAIAVQQMMHGRKIARGEQLSLRIGIHVGDVVESGSDILGDAVNIASRIEPLAEPGGICVSSEVYGQVRNKIELRLVSLGEKALKNVEMPVGVFKVVMPWEQQSATKEEIVLPRDRIAILPFANMSPDPGDEYFADGMTEEIISTVSGISGLNVISRTSVMGYKGTTKKVEEIGKELRAGSVLEGSFRKAGNKIRVTAQLIDVASDRHLWAQNYDRNLDDVFEVQSDVAKQVAEALRVRILSPEMKRIEKKPTESAVAYTLYLQGRYYWNRRDIENSRKAIGFFEQAIREDPRFALGYVGHADCTRLLRDNWGVEPDANLQKSRSMVVRALELDPELAEAHTSLACLLMDEYNLRQAEEEFRRAIELKPNYASAHQWYSSLLLAHLRWDEALEEIGKALELDPLSPIINVNYGDFFSNRRDYRRAIEPYKRAAELGWDLAPGNLASAYGRMKMFDDMKREGERYVELIRKSMPLARTYVDGMYAYYMNDRQTLRRLLPELEPHYGEPGISALLIASVYFCLGENDKGFVWLERSHELKESGILYVKLFPELDGVRNDPRYLDLLKRLGLDQTAQSTS